MRTLGYCFLSLLTLASLGCASASESTWVRAQGGTLNDTNLNRAQAVCSRLAPSIDKPVHVHVLNSANICAYGWPDGNLFVTRGLMDRLNDRELMAAIAHEMGHLLDDGHLRTIVSLRGCCISPDAEARADAIGLRLLNKQGIGGDAMVSMLKKVQSSSGVPLICQQAIAHRIELLTAAARQE